MEKLSFLSSVKTTSIGLCLSLFGSAFAYAETSPADCQVLRYETGIRYQQQSAEIQALQLQTYALATLRLEQAIAKYSDALDKIAIVADIDETIIDNSQLLVRDMQNCHDFTSWDTWGDWELEGKPTLIPGAIDFFRAVDKAGIKIFYVSDRFQENKAATLNTLNALGLPQVSNDTVLLADSSKIERRASVSKHYTVIMLLGDSLPDFSADFTSKLPLAEQQQQVQKNKDQFGKAWIIFPNAAYGNWHKATLKPWDKPLK